MHIHKEGYKTLTVSGAALFALNTLGYMLLPRMVFYGVFGVSGAAYALLTSFFRSPARQTPAQPNTIFAPADGVVVNIERVRETEYFNDERLVVSIFLSVFNVHINWVPVQGKVTYF